MASSNGQSKRPVRRGPDSAPTRRRLLDAAAELIAEVGWGRVTTRAVASRAGLPHGAVSYHFSGKQELLIEAALSVIEEGFPIAELQAATTLTDLMVIAGARLADSSTTGSAGSAVVLEAMRESERDSALRARIATLEQRYRVLLISLISAEQQRGIITSTVPPAALATLLVAAADGLQMQALLDPEVDIGQAVAALYRLLTC
jgi:AcrR family transcriptional regulator